MTVNLPRNCLVAGPMLFRRLTKRGHAICGDNLGKASGAYIALVFHVAMLRYP
jgi:hypothetical protein